MGATPQAGSHEVFSPTPLGTRMRASAATDGGTIESVDMEDHRLVFHQLSAHQFFLEQEIEKLRQVQEKLRREYARYRKLYDKAPVGYCTLSADGVILEANETSVALLGAQLPDLIGQPFERYIHPEDREQFRFRQSAAEGRMPQIQEGRIMRSDGSALWASFRLFLVAEVNKAHRLGNEYHLIITDISGLHQR